MLVPALACAGPVPLTKSPGIVAPTAVDVELAEVAAERAAGGDELELDLSPIAAGCPGAMSTSCQSV